MYVHDVPHSKYLGPYMMYTYHSKYLRPYSAWIVYNAHAPECMDTDARGSAALDELLTYMRATIYSSLHIHSG